MSIFKDEEKYGEYRTKRAILEIYDAMLAAQRSGQAYQTRLDPPPGPPEQWQARSGKRDAPDGDEKESADWPSHIHERRYV